MEQAAIIKRYEGEALMSNRTLAAKESGSQLRKRESVGATQSHPDTTPAAPPSVGVEPKSENLPQVYTKWENGDTLRDIPEGPEMVFVKGGTFLMGSDEDESEKPIHPVTVPSFWMGKYPVTFEEYDAFCNLTGREKASDNGWGRGLRPAINVSWQDAQEYCQWLSEKTGEQYRLPSEAEWEFGARGGTLSKGYKFAGSNDLEKVGWYDENSKNETHPVGEKAANELGLHDMSGNVWEWIEDDWNWNENYSYLPTDNGS
ncbi:MAG: formylglycine-generating enzyme family protein [Saprospiraceae bacterium]